MKVAPTSEAVRSANRVNEKRENKDGREFQQHFQQKKKDEPDNTETVTDEKVKMAIESFAIDQQNRTNGITAAQVGSGPGLKVILRDGTGAVIRQFTGEEFIRVREAANTDGRIRGKILDQKL